MAGTRARMLCISAVMTCLAVLVMATTANADPINPPIRGLIVTMNCDQLGSFDAIAEGNGRWDRAAIPQHALDSNRVLIAYAEHYEFTPTGGSTIVLLDAAKLAPANGRLDECHFSDTDSTGTFNGTIWVTYTAG
jgi:hypothetical protein